MDVLCGIDGRFLNGVCSYLCQVRLQEALALTASKRAVIELEPRLL